MNIGRNIKLYKLGINNKFTISEHLLIKWVENSTIDLKIVVFEKDDSEIFYFNDNSDVFYFYDSFQKNLYMNFELLWKDFNRKFYSHDKSYLYLLIGCLEYKFKLQIADIFQFYSSAVIKEKKAYISNLKNDSI